MKEKRLYNLNFKNIKKAINLELLGNIALLIFLFCICFFFPYTQDDWEWGSYLGIDLLTSYFADYNGRWASNILVIILTRCRILKAIIICLTLVFLVIIAKNFINKERKNLIYLIAILLLLMPHNIIAQAIAWTSGYVNYVQPVLLILFYIYINKSIFTKEEIKTSNKWLIPMLLFGFITSLMIENITIYNVVLSLFIIIYYYTYTKKLKLTNIFYSIGSILGAIFMFSNGAYRNMFNSLDNYQTIKQGNLIIKAIKSYFGKIHSYLFQNNIILNIFIAVVALILVYSFFSKNKNKIKKSVKVLLIISSILIIGYISYQAFIYIANNTNIFITNKYKNGAEGLGNILFGLSVILIILLCIKDKNRKFRLLFEIFSIILLVAPLFIVNPIGPRNFFAPYFIFTIFAVDLFDYTILKPKINVSIYLLGITLVLVIFYFIIYAQIFIIDNKRTNYLKTHQEQSPLYLPNIPNEDYFHYGNPKKNSFIRKYKIFYNIDKDTKVIFIDYNEWLEKVKAD